MFPIILLLIVSISLFSTIGTVLNGGTVEYSERAFEEYANEQYAAAFGESDSYETNLLVVFLTEEKCEGYYCIAFIGDFVAEDIKEKFGNEYTEFGRSVQSAVPEYYEYSLSSNLASVMNKMAQSIEREGLSSSFMNGYTSDTSIPSRVVNYSNVTLNETTVNTALADFTERTDIPAVIVLDTAENVFGKTMPTNRIVFLSVIVIIAIVAIVSIVTSARKRKNGNGGGGNNGGNNSGYDDGSGRTYDDGSGRSYNDGSDRQNW